ncbi:sugar transporter, putative [Talaromyces stipitatus ATCC 10500]|uniref:Sugar transporter, putative n=1 Tax=Talaromyces stipitatus (strain ATCC 10500 / CBS 375.48 / QM 6759 / NRRL 1006) TaxID=441959 RepID=B8M3V2_TALSN|nr:sugar transporter, putative [Talaromyces stipitatus ATCC 10500]EED20695.1 sugar transporter, putative [Talaromyces stipitatus ATCC 10500]
MGASAPNTESPLIVGALKNKGATFSWLSNAGIVKLNLMLLIFQISSYATGYDGSMMNGLQSLTTWQDSFNNPGASELGLLNAIQNVGQLVTMPICAFSCDRFGRRPVLFVSAFILLIGVALQAAAQNVGMFIAARGIIGMGLVLNITAAPLLLLELAYPRQQGPQVAVYNSLWNLGALAAAWITFGTFRIESTWAWRIPSLLQGLSSVIQIGLCFLVEESPRWLISKERDEEARRLICKYHANGDESDPLIILEMEEIRTALRLEAEARRNTSYLTFFQTKANLKRFFIILCVGFFSQWSGNGLISYYLTLILDSIGYQAESTQTLINALLALWTLIWSVIFAALMNRFGRRTLFLISTAGSLAVYVVWTGLEATYEKKTALDGTGGDGYAKGVLAMIFLFNFFYSVGWTPLQVTYCIEILPFDLRARGLVLYNLFVALANIFNQYVNPIGVTNSKWKYYITYDVWLLFELVVVYFLFVETGNLSLEETAVIMDGQEYENRLIEGAVSGAEKKLHQEPKRDVAVETKALPSDG